MAATSVGCIKQYAVPIGFLYGPANAASKEVPFSHQIKRFRVDLFTYIIHQNLFLIQSVWRCNVCNRYVALTLHAGTQAH